MEHIVKIVSIGHVTHDVIQIIAEKPEGYVFEPGQATDVAINKAGWKDELRAFTFTSIPSDNYVQFTIKTYPSRNGVTNQLLQLKKDDEIILHDVFGDIAYQGEGLFIAGGAGITPFLAILKQLHAQQNIGHNKLIFANKTKADIIHEQKFKDFLGSNFINVLSDETNVSLALTNSNEYTYEHGYITEEMLKKHILLNQPIYLCGPPPMMEAIEKHLANLHIADSLIVKEGF